MLKTHNKNLQIPEIINSKINIRELLKNTADSPLLEKNIDAVNIRGIEISETWNWIKNEK